MKKATLITVFLLLFSINFVSCDTEPIDNNALENAGDNGGTDDGGDDGSDDDNDGGTDDDGGTGTADGSYWPMALNNSWTYDQDGKTEEPMKLIGKKTVNGKAYFATEHFFSNAGSDGLTGAATILLRQSEGSYYALISVEIPENEGVSISVSPYELILLKDNLDVGKTWSQKVFQVTSFGIPGIPDVTTQIDVLGTILEKGITFTDNGKQYKDVIKCKVKQTIGGTVLTTTYWFAKNIGPLKSQTVGDGVNSTTTLLSYKLN